jgi:hypothetical protein
MYNKYGTDSHGVQRRSPHLIKKYINKHRVQTTSVNVCSIRNIIVYACFFVQTIRLLYNYRSHTRKKYLLHLSDVCTIFSNCGKSRNRQEYSSMSYAQLNILYNMTNRHHCMYSTVNRIMNNTTQRLKIICSQKIKFLRSL